MSAKPTVWQIQNLQDGINTNRFSDPLAALNTKVIPPQQQNDQRRITSQVVFQTPRTFMCNLIMTEV